MNTSNAMWECFVIKKSSHSGLKFDIQKFGLSVQILNGME